MLKNNPTINIILTIPQMGAGGKSRMNSIVHRNKKPSLGPLLHCLRWFGPGGLSKFCVCPRL